MQIILRTLKSVYEIDGIGCPVTIAPHHRTYIRVDTVIIIPTRKNLEGLLYVSLATLTKFNFVLFWEKLHIFYKTLAKCKKRYLINQQFVKGLINILGQVNSAQS